MRFHACAARITAVSRRDQSSPHAWATFFGLFFLLGSTAVLGSRGGYVFWPLLPGSSTQRPRFLIASIAGENMASGAAPQFLQCMRRGALGLSPFLNASQIQ